MKPSVSNISPVWKRYTGIVTEHAKGCKVYDIDGTEYLDFTSGIAVTSTGHCHPRVVEAIRDQAGRLIHGQVNVMVHTSLLELIGEMRTIVPASMDGFYFSNSGAEAVEGALKLAKMATKRPNIIVFQGAFHGRTVGTMSLTTSKTIYRAGYQPLMSGVFIAPFPYHFRYSWDPEECSEWCLNELHFLLQTQTAAEETAAILVEPILGEGGFVVPPKSFLQGIREICNEYKILLIFDEIQSGIGRTGRWFAHEHFGIEPDIMTIAKGLASGLPLSAVVSRMELMEKWVPGSHGGTYGGNAIACAAAIATIQTIKEEYLLETANLRGAQLIDALYALQARHSCIGDVRGLGLMVGVEFNDSDGKPNAGLAKAIVQTCQEKGLLLLTCGPWDNTIRFLPPLVVSSDEVEQATSVFAKSLKELSMIHFQAGRVDCH